MSERSKPFEGSANWLIAVFACLILWYGSTIVLVGIFSIWSTAPRIASNPAVIDAFVTGSSPTGVFWNLATFVVYVALLWAILRGFHRRTFRHILAPGGQMLWPFAKVCAYLIPIYAIVTVPSVFDTSVYQQISPARWIALLPIGLPLLMVQIGAEELVFRGYLQSHLAALSKRPVVWMVIPSVMFGLIHYDGTQPAYSAWAYVIWATALGLVCADVTARSGSLAPALAIHFVNNAFAIFVLAADDWIFGAALYVWPTYGAPWEPWVPFEALFLFTVWIATRLAIRR